MAKFAPSTVSHASPVVFAPATAAGMVLTSVVLSHLVANPPSARTVALVLSSSAAAVCVPTVKLVVVSALPVVKS